MSDQSGSLTYLSVQQSTPAVSVHLPDTPMSMASPPKTSPHSLPLSESAMTAEKSNEHANFNALNENVSLLPFCENKF